MTFFGETIRKAREAKGLTLSEVAQKTHILVQTLSDMEQENFKRIPAAIYGRGFVRHICECLEIDPKPLVAEFMDIYQGRKKPTAIDPFQPKKALTPSPVSSEPKPPVAEQLILPAQPQTTPEVSTPAEPEPAIVEPTPAIVEPTPAIVEPTPSIIEPVTPTAVAEPLPKVTEPLPEMAEPVAPSPEPQSIPEPTPEETPTELKGLDLFDPPPTMEEPPAKPAPSIFDAPMASAEPPPVTRAQDIFSTSYTEPEIDEGPSAAEKFRESLSVVSHGVLGGVRKIPRSAWRIAILAVGALFVLVLLIWGCTVLYRITEKPVSPTIPPEAQPTAPAATVTATSAKGSPATAPKSQTATATTKKTGQATTPSQNVKLRSTGEKVPPLYVD
ncbi:MAG: helix-turn-helix domain-containing protein [Kiritimatiellae bacterium]|nr:helix-turn-helix domain-containing protein [Kiritimatiellia bacterium]